MMVALHNLSVGYDRRPVVHHVTGSFGGGTLTAIIGPNGGGKSTLLKSIAGFVPIMTGRVDLAGLCQQDIAYLPQQFEIDRTFPISVMDVVLQGHWPHLGSFGRRGRKHHDEAMKALALVDMEAFATRPILSLSTGQWQRVLFARLSLQRAKLILLDEPFAAIDGRTTHDLVHVLEQWSREGRTIICVVHDFNLVRDHFPQTLIMARELIAWGETVNTLTDDNLARASAAVGSWSENADICSMDHRGAA